MKIPGTILMIGIVMMVWIPGSATPGGPMKNQDQELLNAAGRNDTARIERLLNQGASVQAQDEKVQTPLLVAVDRNHVESARLLIEAGSDVNAQDHQLDSPLLLAGARGYLEILKLILKAKPDFMIYNRYGGTALIPACERGHVETVRTLLQTDVDINHVNRLGWTALLETIILGDGGLRHQEIVQLLITGGADINLRDGEGVSPLQHAGTKGFTPIVNMLESAGAR